MFGIVERETGRIHARHIPVADSWNVRRELGAVVAPQARMMSDESGLYASLKKMGLKHEIVLHTKKEWVRGDVHTQTIESFWSLLKRGIIGSFHQVSIKHLQRYISEFSYRFNNRDNEELFTITVAALALGIPLPYAKLIGRIQPSETSPDDVSFSRFRGIADLGNGVVAKSLRITPSNWARST